MRVVLADDHPVLREGLRLLINSQADMHVAGVAADGERAVSLTREIAPDILIIDLSMPLLSGTEAMRRVRAECPDVKIVVLTVHEERDYLTEAIKLGASAYVLKRAAPDDIVRALRVAAAGDIYIDPAVSGALVESYLVNEKAAHAESNALSEREREVLIRIARGFSNREVAAELGISVKTVETYKARVSQKLGITSRVDIVRFAAREGWLT